LWVVVVETCGGIAVEMERTNRRRGEGCAAFEPRRHKFPDQIKQVLFPDRFVDLKSMPVCRPCSSSPTRSSPT
jgi:hypothetical protein